MSQSWSGRIGEGLVIGISASVMFLVFTSMNDAREELTTARETIEIQLDVNQELLDKTDDLEERVQGLDRKIDSIRYEPRVFEDFLSDKSAPTVGSAPTEESGPAEVNPTSSTVTAPSISDDVFLRVPSSNVQQRIDQQRQLVK